MSNSTAIIKQEIRKQARTTLSLNAAHADEWAARIRDSLAASDLWRSARTILAFLPLPLPAVEPDLSPLLAAAMAEGRRICLPRIDWEAGQMAPALMTDLAAAMPTRHGIREPRPDASTMSLAEIDLILVPALALDMAGNRLGRGAGFYDRFLSRRQGAPPQPPACGVGFEIQLVDRIPTDPWDVPMNAVVTERRLVTLPA